jgi:hypothetical protein
MLNAIKITTRNIEDIPMLGSELPIDLEVGKG